MARINLNQVQANVTAPDSIEVPLVRADQLGTSNIFRVFFEIFLSLSAALIGVLLSTSEIAKLHWVALTTCITLSITFAWLTYSYSKKAHEI